MKKDYNIEKVKKELNQLHDKVLFKTAFKGVIYLLIASIVTYFYPEKTWVWYVVAGLIGIGVAFVLFTYFANYKLSKAQEDDS